MPDAKRRLRTTATGRRRRKPVSASAVAQGAGVDAAVGGRLRELRRRRRLRLEDLASKTGLSIGYLSQIERGLSSPSLRALAVLTRVFGINLGALLGALAPTSSRDPIVVRKAERPTLALWRDGISKQLLTKPSAGSKLSLYLVHIAPGAHSGDAFYVHEGEEAGVVLNGSMELEVESQRWRLKSGDTFRFPSSVPHRFANPGARPVIILWVNGS